MDLLDEYGKSLRAPDSYKSIRSIIESSASSDSEAIKTVKVLADALESSGVPPEQARTVLVSFCKNMSK